MAARPLLRCRMAIDLLLMIAADDGLSPLSASATSGGFQAFSTATTAAATTVAAATTIGGLAVAAARPLSATTAAAVWPVAVPRLLAPHSANLTGASGHVGGSGGVVVEQ